MFDDKFKAEYQNIKAPKELYSRIIDSAASEVKSNNIVQFRKIGSLAAAVAVIIICGLFFMNADKSPEVFVGTEKLTEQVQITEAQSSSLMLARMNTDVSCELKIALKTETEISLNKGFLMNYDGEVILEEENTAVFSDKFSCKWVVPQPDENQEYCISLKDKKGECTIRLFYDRDVLQWTACLEK